ncbi:hypothetical protein F4824DRAFT_499819 [Ustulina deusta]|nr:hypothetical protein F4824DRAFT_499819 [Ustulina deusta]
MPSRIPNTLAIAVTLFLTWRLCVLGYCFTLHPLRRFPGPFIAKLSGLYGAFLALAKSSHLIIARDHRKYGRALREFQYIILEQIEIFIGLMYESAKNVQVVNMTERLQRMVMDIIGHLAFGYAFNL